MEGWLEMTRKKFEHPDGKKIKIDKYKLKNRKFRKKS